MAPYRTTVATIGLCALAVMLPAFGRLQHEVEVDAALSGTSPCSTATPIAYSPAPVLTPSPSVRPWIAETWIARVAVDCWQSPTPSVVTPPAGPPLPRLKMFLPIIARESDIGVISATSTPATSPTITPTPSPVYVSFPGEGDGVVGPVQLNRGALLYTLSITPNPGTGEVAQTGPFSLRLQTETGHTVIVVGGHVHGDPAFSTTITANVSADGSYTVTVDMPHDEAWTLTLSQPPGYRPTGT